MIVFRKAENEDIDFIEKLENESFEKGLAWSRNLIESAVKDESFCLYILSNDNVDIGYGGYQLIGDEMDINNIAVKREEQNKGYGKRIMGKIIEDAKEKKVKKIFLEVREDNYSAINLYEKMEFEKISLRKNYYADKTAFIYLLEIHS